MSSVFADGILHEVEYGDRCTTRVRTDEELTELAREIVQGRASFYGVEDRSFLDATSMLRAFSPGDATWLCPIHSAAFVGTYYNPHSYAVNGTPMFLSGHMLTWDERDRLAAIAKPMYEALGVVNIA